MKWTLHKFDAKGAWATLALLCVTFSLAAQTNVSFAPPPDWVRQSEWAAAAQWPRQEKTEGTRYLLYEYQEHPKRTEEFLRVVLLMENETGVQDSGSLSFGFDPNFQELILHRVLLHRGGKSIDRLDQSKLRVIQPEPGLNGHMITGRQTALLFVEDLRVGDALEYAYTIRGANPILAGHYSSRFVVQSGTPVERELFRVVWDSPLPLSQRAHLTDARPVTKPWQTGTEYTWNFTNLTAIPYEDYQPASYEPYPYVELSDFADWSSVVNWALPLYATSPTNPPADLRELIMRWQRTAGSAEEQARLALQFVQDDLRYTALELGPDSYRPAEPIETFQKRFGDCKGKVALLCYLLQALEIEAYPALVNSSVREAIAARLPSPFAFNHVIVKLNLEGKSIWVDPTYSHQGGSLWSRYVPPLGKALVIRPGNEALEDVPRAHSDNASHQKTTSTLTIKDYELPVKFAVHTAYRGASADSMREEIARTDRSDLTKNYLNFYARFYPDITTDQPLKIIDDRLANLLSIEESYRITNFWKLEETEKLWRASFYADNLYNVLTDPNTRIRNTPLRFSYPLQRQQEIAVHLPDGDWDIPELEKNIEHEAFTFNYRRKFGGSTVRFNYECTTRLATLPPESVPGYLAKLDEMENLLADTLQRPNGTADSFAARINWLMVIITGFGLVGTAVVGGWYWRHTTAASLPDPDAPPELAPEAQHLKGLGGWLVLIGFGLCVAPLIRLVTLGQNWEGYFSIHVWQSIAMPQGELYHPLYGPLLMFELLGNTVLLGWNILALGLYFAKRRAFPRVYIGMLVLNAVFLILDDLGCGQISSLQTSAADHREAGRATLYAILWSAYMLKSRRVKATFIK
jgi:hypothetical protein